MLVYQVHPYLFSFLGCSRDRRHQVPRLQISGGHAAQSEGQHSQSFLKHLSLKTPVWNKWSCTSQKYSHGSVLRTYSRYLWSTVISSRILVRLDAPIWCMRETKMLDRGLAALITGEMINSVSDSLLSVSASTGTLIYLQDWWGAAALYGKCISMVKGVELALQDISQTDLGG